MSIVIDVSPGDQAYTEDCQVCCQPMLVSISTDDGRLLGVDVAQGG